MHRLQVRLQQQGVILQEFYVDNCCALRQKIQGVFGSQVKVFLDIFHAVQRVTKKIPKKHPYCHECLKSLTLVFRDPVDQGPVRTMVTPPIDQLKKQVLAFKAKWKDINHNDKPILPPEAIAELQSLLVHINKGCLSGIAPGRGTNRNERLHRDLNSHMSNCKYGLEFSCALLTSTFFQHNEHIAAGMEKRNPLPITAYNSTDELNSEVESFGLSTVNRHSSTICEYSVTPDMDKVPMKSLQHSQVQESLNEVQLETPEGTDEDAEFSLDDSLLLLKQAISSFFVTMSMQKMSSTAEFNDKDVFFTSSLALISGFRKQNLQ